MGGTRGSIYIELIIGTAILAAGLFLIFLSFTTFAERQIRHRQQLIALVAAQSELETIRASTYDSLIPGVTTLPIVELPDGLVTTEVTSVLDDLKQVVVTASWGVEHVRTLELVTQVTSDGMESL